MDECDESFIDEEDVPCFCGSVRPHSERECGDRATGTSNADFSGTGRY